MTTTTSTTQQPIALVYCRISNKRDNNFSISGQENICTEYCNKNNILIYKTICEIISVRNIGECHRLELVMDEMEKNGVSRIIVSNVSRFSRNTREALHLLEKLRQRNITVHSVLDNCSYDGNSTNKFQFRNCLNLAEFESDQLSDRLRTSVVNRKKIGHKIGKAKFGFEIYYDENGVRRERHNQHEMEILRTIRDMKYDGKSTREISDHLNKKRMFTTRWKPWTYLRVYYVVRMTRELS